MGLLSPQVFARWRRAREAARESMQREKAGLNAQHALQQLEQHARVFPVCEATPG